MRRPAATAPGAARFPLRVSSWLLLLSAAALPVAAARSFSSFKEYDDEGILLLWNRELAAGHPLYDEVWNFYGPLTYLVHQAFYQLPRLAVGHDAARLLTALLWVLACALTSLVALRATRSLALASALHFALLLHLAPLTGEPGHPNALLAVLLPLGMGLGFARDRGAVRARNAAGDRGIPSAHWTDAGLGGLTAALLLCKLNAGVFFAAGLGVAYLASQRRAGRPGAGPLAAMAASAALPLVVLGGDAFVPAWRGLAWGAACSAALVAWTASRGAGSDAGFALGPSLARCLAGAALAALGLGAATCLWLGSTPMALIESVFLLPLRLQSWIGVRAAAHRPGLLGPCLALGSFVLWSGAARFAGSAAATRVLLVLRVSFVALSAHAVTYPDARAGYALLLERSLPLLWLLTAADAANSAGPWGSTARFARTLLASGAAFQGLQLYPVAGSQAALATGLLLLCAAVAAGDVLHAVRQRIATTERARFLWAVLGTAALGALTGGYWVQARDAVRFRASQTPLELPGARFVHAREEQVAVLRWLAAQVTRDCDGFAGVPGLPSLYLFTGRDAPTRRLNIFEPSHQAELFDALLSSARPCLIWNERALRFWNRSETDPPAVLALRQRRAEEFRPFARAGDWVLHVAASQPDPQPILAARVTPRGSDPAASLELFLPEALAGRAVHYEFVDARSRSAPADPPPGPTEGSVPLDFATPPSAGIAGDDAARGDVVRLTAPASGPLLARLARRSARVRVFDADGVLLAPVPVLVDP